MLEIRGIPSFREHTTILGGFYMKYFFNKLFTVILVTIILTSSNIGVFAASHENSSSINTQENSIIAQAIDLDQSEKVQGKNFSIVTLLNNKVADISINNKNIITNTRK